MPDLSPKTGWRWRDALAAAEQRAERAERDLALEMDSRGRWAARAEDAEKRAERLAEALRKIAAIVQHERERP